MKNAVCFDIGGTFIKYGVINENGYILFKDKFKTPLVNCRKTIPENLIAKINEIKKSWPINAAGISTAGEIDNVKGEVILSSDNLPQYTGAKLKYEIETNTGLKCYVENDVNSAALGEMWKGRGIGEDTFICLTIGTGIGAGIIINGKLYRGRYGCAGEVGHMIIHEDGEKCNCGMNGCYENYASTSALVRNCSLKMGINMEDLDGEKVMEMVKSGNKITAGIYDEFLNHIVTGLINLTRLFDPGLIIIGGGISAAGDYFFDELNKKYKNSILPFYAEHTKIVQAKLKNDAGLIGAGYLVFNHYN